MPSATPARKVIAFGKVVATSSPSPPPASLRVSSASPSSVNSFSSTRGAASGSAARRRLPNSLRSPSMDFGATAPAGTVIMPSRRAASIASAQLAGDASSIREDHASDDE